MDQREIFDGLVAAGYVSRTGMILNAIGAYWWLHARGVSAPQADSGLNLQQGTVTRFTIEQGLAPLTGLTGVNRPADVPAQVGTVYGSGVAGRQADAAPGIDLPGYIRRAGDEPIAPVVSRQEQWSQIMLNGGWRINDHAAIIKEVAEKNGVSLDEVEDWGGHERGAIMRAIERSL